ncbi:MAG TPA: hypothetical protein VGK32_23125 [Vicinamibacterales bacterium]|jgi:hypothetical protein
MSKTVCAAARLAGIAALAVLVNIGIADAAGQTPAPKAAKEQVAAPKAVKPAKRAVAKPVVPDDGFRTATRLGGPRSLIGSIKDLKQLKRDMARPRVKKNVDAVITEAGLTSLKDQILGTLTAADSATLKDEPFEVGKTMVWMGLRNAGKAAVLRNIRWGGKKPFPAWTFDIDDGETLYHFALPKPCGNLALASSERSPKAIAAEAARKAEEARLAEEARKRVEEEAARKVVPPPPPPPPAPASCGLTATAIKAKGGWSVTIDGSQSQSGGSPATSMVVQVLGPTGAPVSVEYQGKPATELTLAAPFQASVLIRKPLPGTYTVKANSTAANPKADKSSCQATFTVIAEDKMDFFFEGAFGKERRVRVADPLPAGAKAGFEYGYCAPLFGVKAGVDLLVAEDWRVAPSAGVAINFNKSGNSSAFAEVEINRWFDRNGFFGTGIGVWDFTHSDTVAPVWLLQGGRRLWKASGANQNELHFVVTGRLFLNKMDDISNNYQFWGGFRYIFR